MSFADELRKGPAAPAYRLDEQRLDACVRAIKDACMKNRTAGHLAGYLEWYNDDGYMKWRIIPEPKILSKKDVNEWEYVRQKIYRRESNLYNSGMKQGNDPVFKTALQQKLDELGFSSVVLKTVKLEQLKETIWQGALGGNHVKYEKTGEIIYALYVDIRW